MLRKCSTKGESNDHNAQARTQARYTLALKQTSPEQGGSTKPIFCQHFPFKLHELFNKVLTCSLKSRKTAKSRVANSMKCRLNMKKELNNKNSTDFTKRNAQNKIKQALPIPSGSLIFRVHKLV